MTILRKPPVTLESRMNFGFGWMIQGWFLKFVPRLITNSPIPRQKHEALLKQRQLGSILGRYRIFMKLAEFLGLVAVVAIGLVAANTAAMSIRERRSEIAVMRSIGFPSGVILSLLVGESLIVALLGGAIGCGVAFGLFKVFALNADALGPFVSLHVPPFVLAETLGVAALIGLFSAYVPARAAAKRSIVETLRLVD